MKLLSAQVRHFRNIIDSADVEVEDDVTCLVGKNESGKTAFLYALYRLNPWRPEASLKLVYDYPAWLQKRHESEGINLEESDFVVATFQLGNEEQLAIEERFGKGALKSDRIIATRNYADSLSLLYKADEQKAVKHAVSQASLKGDKRSSALEAQDLDDLSQKAGNWTESENDAELGKAVQAAIKDMLGDSGFSEALEAEIEKLLPKFFYSSSYATLPGTVKIRELLAADPKTLDEDSFAALSLLRQAGADEDYLLTPDYDERKRELENVANRLTQEIISFWSQNPGLRVLIDITQRTEEGPEGETSVLDELKVRIWDDRHSLSLRFDEKSTGFQWFFSFLAAFSDYERRNEPVVILLDEPALGLHARAQGDFLRFIEERLANRHQVLYTTHSPFMVPVGQLERVRLVEDRGIEEGALVSAEVMAVDPDTLFPLQGALGYDIAQHLFIGPDNLVVEGTSDYTYLTVISDYLKEQGRTHLDDRWFIIPVGGADYIPTFVALLGHHLDVTVLVDSKRGGHQRLSVLQERGYMPPKRIVLVGEPIERKVADIEDVFAVDDYLSLYNKAFGKRVKAAELTGTDTLIARIARHDGVDRFDHGKPADYLLRKRDEVLPQLSEDTFSRFEKLFSRINDTLG